MLGAMSEERKQGTGWYLNEQTYKIMHRDRRIMEKKYILLSNEPVKFNTSL